MFTASELARTNEYTTYTPWGHVVVDVVGDGYGFPCAQEFMCSERIRDA